MAERAVAEAGTAEEKVLGVLTVKPEVAIRLWQDSPHTPTSCWSRPPPTPLNWSAYMDHLARLLTFTRGLEDDLRDSRPRAGTSAPACR
ncbi:hypothetical protein [Streptomyces griseofuscus]|uniref:hypothetical protein n=1 Tax=Streptomyces griseofuscus TaxID=146922 RepID=UPI0036C84DBE